MKAVSLGLICLLMLATPVLAEQTESVSLLDGLVDWITGLQVGDMPESGDEMGMQFDPSGPPASQTEDEMCVDACVQEKCASFDMEASAKNDTPEQIQANIEKFQECMFSHQEECDEKCGMVTEPDYDSLSDEEKCITDCVNKHDPDAICGNSREGETGGDVCQMCAEQCAYLYEGPCLTEEEMDSKEAECISKCEHCYGEMVMGPSGQTDVDGNTWDCIVDVSCSDASSEFGDDPGTGEDSYAEGHEPNENNVVVEAFSGIAEFFGGLFK